MLSALWWKEETHKGEILFMSATESPMTAESVIAAGRSLAHQPVCWRASRKTSNPLAFSWWCGRMSGDGTHVEVDPEHIFEGCERSHPSVARGLTPMRGYSTIIAATEYLLVPRVNACEEHLRRQKSDEPFVSLSTYWYRTGATP